MRCYLDILEELTRQVYFNFNFLVSFLRIIENFKSFKNVKSKLRRRELEVIKL